jgi:hypothetical protein
MASPLLTIETLAPEIPTIDIDGVAYELALPEDFGLREEAANGRLLRRAAKLLEQVENQEADELTDARTAELEKLLSDFMAVILRAPTKVRAKLRFRQKMAIAAAFTQVVTKAPTSSRRTPNRSRSTSASSPRASAPRTARATGSESRSASSRRLS